MVDRVAFLLELLRLDAVAHDVVALLQACDPFAEHGHHALDDLGQQLHALGGWSQPEDLRAARRAVHRVHHVVQIRGELVDVFPVERRDEGAVEPVHDLVRDLVGLVLESLERLDVGRATLGLRREQLAQVVRRLLVAVGDFDEQVEEFLVTR